MKNKCNKILDDKPTSIDQYLIRRMLICVLCIILIGMLFAIGLFGLFKMMS